MEDVGRRALNRANDEMGFEKQYSTFLYKPEYAESERFSFNSNFGVPKGFNDSMYMLNNKSVENRQEQKSILINTLLDMYSNQLATPKITMNNE